MSQIQHRKTVRYSKREMMESSHTESENFKQKHKNARKQSQIYI